MSVASTPSEGEPFLQSGAPPQAGVFTVPSRPWNRTNTLFIHHIAGTERKELPSAPGREPNRFPVPIEEIANIEDFVYGNMPEAMTVRPMETEGCCSCDRSFEVARDMYAPAVAEVKVSIPKFVCLFTGGCAEAEVEFNPKQGTPGNVYKGILKNSFIAGCLDNTMTLEWQHGQKPRMMYRSPATCDQFRYCLCQPIWLGFRGISDATSEHIALYDGSTILRCADAVTLCKMTCVGCQNTCCMSYDLASRFTRPEDVRRVVRTRYDYEFAFRQLDEDNKFEISEGENSDGNFSIMQQLQPTQRVDCLLTSRLYCDVVCGKPKVRFAGQGEGDMSNLAAIDAVYRGSTNHAQPSEDDHLIVLAGAILHGVWTFPGGKGPYGPGPAQSLRGRLVPREGGGDANSTSAV